MVKPLTKTPKGMAMPFSETILPVVKRFIFVWRSPRNIMINFEGFTFIVKRQSIINAGVQIKFTVNPPVTG